MKLEASCVWLLASSVVVSLRGESSNIEEEFGLNKTTLQELLKFHVNPFLQDLAGHWSFNDTNDITKYEEFDHTRFQGGREPSLEELVEKARRLGLLKQRRRATPAPRRPAAQQSGSGPGLSPAETLPSFPEDLQTSVTAQLGSTAFLHCRIEHLNNRAVSWVRKRDWHILTSAMLTYTNDERFQVIHAEGSDDWTLQIKYVQKRDNGPYECQVALGKGTISKVFELTVAIPSARILGTGEYHIGHGSTISLVCIIEDSPIPPQYVMWYHNDELINSAASGALTDSAAGGVARGGETSGGETSRVVTEPGGEKTHSRLLITEATSRHSGNYTCRASNTTPDSVYVFVSTDGDNIAAIQRQSGTQPSQLSLLFLFSTSLILLLR